MGVNASTYPSVSDPGKFTSQTAARAAPKKTARPKSNGFLNRCWGYVKSPGAMVGIGLFLLLARTDPASAKALMHRNVSLHQLDNLRNHLPPAEKEGLNPTNSNTPPYSEMAWPPPLPRFNYTETHSPGRITNRPKPLLETADDGVENGEIMKSLFKEPEYSPNPTQSPRKKGIDNQSNLETSQKDHIRTKRFSGDLIPEESGTDEFLVKVSSPDFYCSGSILSKRKVITAAHCTEKEGKSVILQVDFQGKQYPVKNIRRCPDYAPGGKDASMDDIALLSLSLPLPKSARRLRVNLNFDMVNEKTYRGRVNETLDGEPAIEDCTELPNSSDNPPETRFPEFLGIGYGRYGESCKVFSNQPRKGFFQRTYQYGGHSPHDAKYCNKTKDNTYSDFSDCMSQYSCYFNAKFNRFSINNNHGEKYHTCPGDSGSPLLAFNRKSGQFDLIGVLSGGETYSYLSSHRAWFIKNFNSKKPNQLQVYNSIFDRNLNIPILRPKSKVSDNALQHDLKITLQNKLSTGPWFWRKQWSKLTLDIHDSIYGLKRTTYCYAWNYNSCSIPLTKGSEKISMMLGLGPVTQYYGYQFNITRLNERKQNITFTVYENDSLVVSFQAEPEDVFQPYDQWLENT